MKLLLVYRHRWWLFYVPVLACALLVLWLSGRYWKAPPPGNLIIAVSAQDDSHMKLARRYADKLERIGISTEIVSGGTESHVLDQLSAPINRPVAAFADSGYASTAGPQVRALAAVAREPVWIFSRDAGVNSLEQAGKGRVATGSPNSSSRIAAQLLLKNAGLKSEEINFLPWGGLEAANALLDGKVDLVVQAASPDSMVIQLLVRSTGVHILGIDRSNTLMVQSPRLRAMRLPQGAIELRGDIPSRDLTLVSQQTHLLVQADMHPALQRVLLDAAVDVHEFPDFLHRHGE
jgi:hypothetical protein